MSAAVTTVEVCEAWLSDWKGYRLASGIQQLLFEHLVKLALLLWLWCDRQCDAWGQQVGRWKEAHADASKTDHRRRQVVFGMTCSRQRGAQPSPSQQGRVQ